jgi:GT2 family glycosyltransferase
VFLCPPAAGKPEADFNESMKLSIIIITYNSEHLIGPCLDSIYETIKDIDYEIIVIDNASSDNTVAFLQKKYPKINLVVNSENVGFARGVNQGIKKARGEFILLLNPDMRVLQGTINKSLAYLEKNSEIGILGCQFLYPNMRLQASFGNFPSLFTEFLQTTYLYKFLPWGRFIPESTISKKRFKKIHKVDWLSGGFMILRRDVFKKIGLFDENFFMYLEDIDLCFRARKAGFKIIYFPKAQVIHHHMASTKKDPSRAIINELKSLIYYFKKYKKNIFILKILIYSKLYLQLSRYKLISLFRKKEKPFVEAYKKVLKEMKV